jgi:hypothetical protein
MPLDLRDDAAGADIPVIGAGRALATDTLCRLLNVVGSELRMIGPGT